MAPRPVPIIGTSRLIRAGLIAAATLTCSIPAFAQLEVVVTPQGNAAKERPLPNGAALNVIISIRNTGKAALGRIVITARFDGFVPATTEVWRIEGGAAISALERLAAGERTERTLRLHTANAPLATTKRSIAAEARAKDGSLVTGEAQIPVADCVGAYRAKLETLRSSLSQGVREAAEEMRRPDAGLPAGRAFPYTGARSGEVAAAERLAATTAARRGADAQMATEWFRFMIQRWASELNAYTSQPVNPGLCANNYYQIAGYRQGLLPITRHLDAIKNAAAASLKAAREAAKAESSDDAAVLVRLLVKEADLQPNGQANDALSAIAAARTAFGPRLPAPDAVRKFSLVETAAWLEAADRRAQSLTREIERLLANIAVAHKESCVCAF